MTALGALVPAAMAASAVGVLLARPGDRRRLRRVLPQPEPAPAAEPSSAPRALACALAGLAGWLLLGGVVGLALGALVALAGPRLLARAERPRGDDDEVAAVLPLALDLLAACLAGGAVPGSAVQAVAEAVPGPCGTRLARVGAALAVGSPPAEAWRALGEDRGPAGAAARALARAAEGGAPVATAVQQTAQQARQQQQARGEQRARRAGVLAVLPLGLCFLPAFVLLGVVPAVVGLTGPLLASL